MTEVYVNKKTGEKLSSEEHARERDEENAKTGMKTVFLVIQTPHGDFEEIYGIFTTMTKAIEVCKHYGGSSFAFAPYVVEIDLDQENAWTSIEENAE